MVKKVISTTKKVENTIKKWKYAVVFGREYEEEDLNELGKEGWELCTVLIDPVDPLTKIYYFKREHQYVKKMKGGINMSKNMKNMNK